MKKTDWDEILNGIDTKFIEEAVSTYPKAPALRLVNVKENEMHLSRKTKRNTRRTLTAIALAAALMLALSVTAYATDLFGLRGIQTGKSYEWDGQEFDRLSITQPQAVPDDVKSEIKEKVANNENAWAEWKEYLDAKRAAMPQYPDALGETAPEGAEFADFVDEDDGGCTVNYYRFDYERIEKDGLSYDDKDGWIFVTSIHLSAEEYRQYKDAEAAREIASQSYGDYDWWYQIHTAEDASKLEEIAAKYGMKLRHGQSAYFEKTPDSPEAPNFLPLEDLTRLVNDKCGSGAFFAVDPKGYDKFYCYDEGTFAVSFYSGEKVTKSMGAYQYEDFEVNCYLYNSPYATLSNGSEVGVEVTREELLNSQSRVHVAPDGTELNVVQMGDGIGDIHSTFAYAYLDNSFVAMHIVFDYAPSDAQVDEILDMINYQNIG